MKWPENLDASVIGKLADFFSEKGGPATFAGELYMDSIGWVVSIIISYMGLREVGKWKGYGDKSPEDAVPGGKPTPMSVVGKTLSQGVSLVSGIRSWFKK
jgi:hypothetical protein